MKRGTAFATLDMRETDYAVIALSIAISTYKDLACQVSPKDRASAVEIISDLTRLRNRLAKRRAVGGPVLGCVDAR